MQEELEEERNGEVDTDEAIAYVYRQITASRQLWATAVGLADAKAAEDIDDILFDDECASLAQDHHRSSISSIAPSSLSSKSTDTTKTTRSKMECNIGSVSKAGNNHFDEITAMTSGGARYVPRVRMNTMPKHYQARAA